MSDYNARFDKNVDQLVGFINQLFAEIDGLLACIATMDTDIVAVRQQLGGVGVAQATVTRLLESGDVTSIRTVVRDGMGDIAQIIERRPG